MLEGKSIEAALPSADDIRARFPFRGVLPLAQLVICAVLLWPARAMILYDLGVPVGFIGPPAIFRSDGPILGGFAEWSFHHSMETVTFVNLPAAILELWVPSGQRARAWRSVSCPILGMLFWWIAGRGADALAATRRKKLSPKIGWLETAIGFLFLAGGLTMVIGVEFFSGEDRHVLQTAALVSALWAFLGGLSVAAKIAQWRLRKRLARDSTPIMGIPAVPSTPG